MFRKSVLLMLTVFLVAALAVSCAPAEQKPLVWGSLSDIETLNPILSESSHETDIMNCIFSTLIKVNENLEFEPDLLAELPEISDDGMEYTFKLREGVKFHDGEELTAEDVKFTYEMKMAEGNAVPSRSMWEKIKDFEIIDPYNFKITLNELDVTWLEGWAYSEGMIVPKHIVEEEFEDGGQALTKGGDFSQKPVGSGPYVFKEWEPDDYIMVESFDGYYKGEPKIKEIIFKVIPDTDTLLAQLKAEEIDIYNGAQPNQYKELLKMKEDGMAIEVHNYESFIYMHADFNLRHAALKDKVVRQALNYAFPKEDFIDTVLDGVGTVAHSCINSINWAFTDDVTKYDYNPEKAKQILDDAGWKPGDDGVRVKDGVRLSFQLSTNSGNKVREDFCNIAAQEWEAIGAEVEQKHYEAATLFGDILDGLKFDIIVFGWVSGFDPDCKTLWHSEEIPDPETGATGQNYVGYVNPEMDRLLDEGLKETDKEKRKEIYAEVQKIISDDVPYLFVYFYNSVSAVPADLKNFKPNPTQANNTWNVWEWSW